MRSRALIAATIAVVGITSAHCATRDYTRKFPSELRPAVRAAVDSFGSRRADGRTWAPASAELHGDTVVVMLIDPAGLRDPGKWDGPRLIVWVVDDRRIVRSTVEMSG